MRKTRTIIKVSSYTPITKNQIHKITEENKLKIESFTFLKKKHKGLISLISGPHVHKKSRDQYTMQEYLFFYEIILKNKKDLKKFSQYKIGLLELASKQGLRVTYTFVRKHDLKLTF